MEAFPRVIWKSGSSPPVWIGKGISETSGIREEEELLSSIQFLVRPFSAQTCRGIWSAFPSSLNWSGAILSKDLSFSLAQTALPLPPLLRREDSPSFQEWKFLIQHTLTCLEREFFHKVVLARQTTLTFGNRLNPLEILKLFNQVSGETTVYLIQLDEKTAFLGATPEKLFIRREREFTTEVVAGTKTCGEAWGEKEKLEAEWVQYFIHKRLLPHCSTIHDGEWQEKKFGDLYHLHRIIRASLKEEIDDFQLVGCLHPTPALGGYPQREALSYLSSVETLDRGWYGGVLGVRSKEETNLVVAIRCALILGNQMHLFSGAGIVKGSTAEVEWKELDRKINHIIRLL